MLPQFQNSETYADTVFNFYLFFGMRLKLNDNTIYYLYEGMFQSPRQW